MHVQEHFFGRPGSPSFVGFRGCGYRCAAQDISLMYYARLTPLLVCIYMRTGVGMPYPADHRKRTRVRILGSARTLFNRHGFERVSIDEIMADAGLTHGGFYSYFRSKTELYAEAVALGLETVARLRQIETADPPRSAADAEAAQRMARAYLSRQHFDDLDGSCPLAALPSDGRRSDPVVRQAFEAVFK